MRGRRAPKGAGRLHRVGVAHLQRRPGRRGADHGPRGVARRPQLETGLRDREFILRAIVGLKQGVRLGAIAGGIEIPRPEHIARRAAERPRQVHRRGVVRRGDLDDRPLGLVPGHHVDHQRARAEQLIADLVAHRAGAISRDDVVGFPEPFRGVAGDDAQPQRAALARQRKHDLRHVARVDEKPRGAAVERTVEMVLPVDDDDIVALGVITQGPDARALRERSLGDHGRSEQASKDDDVSRGSNHEWSFRVGGWTCLLPESARARHDRNTARRESIDRGPPLQWGLCSWVGGVGGQWLPPCVRCPSDGRTHLGDFGW